MNLFIFEIYLKRYEDKLNKLSEDISFKLASEINLTNALDSYEELTFIKKVLLYESKKLTSEIKKASVKELESLLEMIQELLFLLDVHRTLLTNLVELIAEEIERNEEPKRNINLNTVRGCLNVIWR